MDEQEEATLQHVKLVFENPYIMDEDAFLDIELDPRPKKREIVLSAEQLQAEHDAEMGPY